jgi:hypothetical protein
VLVGVIDKDHIAVTVLHAGKGHDAVAHGAHLGARGGSEVGAQMGAPGFLDGVDAHGKTAADARELHGVVQIGLAQALAVQRVVGAFLAGFLEPHGLMRLAIVVELGAQHAAGAQRLAIGFQRFIDHGKAVALAQAAAEVQLALEDVGHLHGDTVGNVGGIRGGKEGGANHATREAGLAVSLPVSILDCSLPSTRSTVRR